MERSPLETIINPKSIVFLGASNSVESIGSSQLLNIVRGGYKGKVFPIHKHEKTVLGVQAIQLLIPSPNLLTWPWLLYPRRKSPGYLKNVGRGGYAMQLWSQQVMVKQERMGETLKGSLLRPAEDGEYDLLGPTVWELSTRTKI